MRWLLLAVSFCGAVCAVLSETVSDSKDQTSLTLLTKSPLLCNINETRAVYCKGHNIPQRLEWTNPAGEEVDVKSNLKTRVYVERPKNAGLETSLLALFIKHLQFDDSGNWTCKSGDELFQTIEIFVGEKVTMDVQETTMVGDEDKSIKLPCDAKGTPEPVVQWYRDNVIIEADPTKYSIRKKGYHHILEISNLNHLDPGTYKCRANQEKLSSFTEKNFHLNVRHKPVIIKAKETEVYAIMNEIKNITCRAQANPLPTFSWSKRGENTFYDPLTEEDTYTAEDGTYSVLMLKVVNTSSLGQYKCSVQNNRGRENTFFDVTLGNKPLPPTSVNEVETNAFNITYNVSCLDCVFKGNEAGDPKSNNLTVLGYNFQFVPCREGYDVPYWENATEFTFDIELGNETLFTVSPLVNATAYHARVATRNAAGLSDWLPIHPNPRTKDDAAALTVSLTLLLMAFITTLCY